MYEDLSIGRLLGHLDKNPNCKNKYSLVEIEELQKQQKEKRKLTKSAYKKKVKRQKVLQVRGCSKYCLFYS